MLWLTLNTRISFEILVLGKKNEANGLNVFSTYCHLFSTRNLIQKGSGTAKWFKIFGLCVEEFKRDSRTEYSAVTIIFYNSNFLNMRKVWYKLIWCTLQYILKIPHNRSHKTFIFQFRQEHSEVDFFFFCIIIYSTVQKS